VSDVKNKELLGHVGPLPNR